MFAGLAAHALPMAGCFHCVRGPFGWNTRGLTAHSFLFEYLSSQHICVPRPEKGGKPGCFPAPISCALVLFSERHQPEDIAGPVTCQLQVPAGGLTLGEVGRFHNLQAVSLHLPDFLKQGCTVFFFFLM